MPEELPENEGKPLSPNLYFRNSVPYEHEVILYEQLHPDLKDEVDKIRESLLYSRDGIDLTMTLLNAFNPIESFRSVSKYTMPMLGIGITTGAFLSIAKEVQRQRNGNDDLDEARERRASIILPYRYAVKRTTHLASLIKEIGEKEESPFLRSDAPELLRDYHYGIVDNKRNIVLLKHPLDSNSRKLEGWERLKKMFQWNQKFQRTRFELNKPTMKEKEKVRKPLKRLIPLRAGNIRFAIAHFKFK